MLRARSRQLNKPKKIPPPPTATGSASRAPQPLHRIERGVGGTPPPRGGKHPGGWRRSSASPRGGDTSSSRRGEGAARRERREERRRERGRRKGGRAVAANRTAVWRLGCKPRARTPVGIVVRVLAWRPCGCAVGPAGISLFFSFFFCPFCRALFGALDWSAPTRVRVRPGLRNAKRPGLCDSSTRAATISHFASWNTGRYLPTFGWSLRIVVKEWSFASSVACTVHVRMANAMRSCYNLVACFIRACMRRTEQVNNNGFPPGRGQRTEQPSGSIHRVYCTASRRQESSSALPWSVVTHLNSQQHYYCTSISPQMSPSYPELLQSWALLFCSLQTTIFCHGEEGSGQGAARTGVLFSGTMAREWGHVPVGNSPHSAICIHPCWKVEKKKGITFLPLIYLISARWITSLS